LSRNIPEAMTTLVASLRKKYGANMDAHTLEVMLSAKITSKLMTDINQVIDSWSVNELQQAQDFQLRAMSAENT